MLSGLEVYTPQLSAPELGPAVSLIDDDFINVRNIEGLGPVKATINTKPYATLDGESYFGGFVGKRNIVITCGLNPNYETYSMSDLRHLLYRYFMPKAQVFLHLSSNNLPTVAITGYVEGVEPNIFAKDPEMQVSIICPLPDFVAVSPTVITGEVSNGEDPDVIDYIGNVPTGITLKVEASIAVDEYEGPLRVISEASAPEIFEAAVQIDDNHYFEICSVQGSKYVRSVQVDTGMITNRLPAKVIDSDWPKLYPGDNNFSVIPAVGSEGQAFTLTYFARFGGL